MTFPAYFAILAFGIGIASYLNGAFVQRFGMERLARAAFVLMAAPGFLMLCAALVWNGWKPLAAFMAMGQLAGPGASLGAFYTGTTTCLAAAIFIAGIGALILSEASRHDDLSPVIAELQ